MYSDSKRKPIIILLLITVSLGSCTTLKRYNSVDSPGMDNSLADINLFSAKLMKPDQVSAGKSLWDLSADAQSQFIKILNNRYPDNGMFLSSLNNVYMSEVEESLNGDYVRKDLRLVFSVSRKRDYLKNSGTDHRLSPADRLEYLRVDLSIKDPGVKFTGWNMYSTEYGSIDVGDVSFNRSLDVSTAISASDKKNGTGLSSEAKSSLSRSEEQSVRYRYIKLNARLNEQSIEMEEEGTREIDLTGNIIADVSLEFESTGETVTRIMGLKDSSGLFNNTGQLSIESTIVAVPDIKKIKESIEADLTMYFIYRNVKKGRKTYPEWDDRVRYYEGNVTKPVSLFKDSDYVPGFCCIGTGQGDKKEFISIRKLNGESYPLIFRTYNEAADFREWLVWFIGKNGDKPMKIGKYNLQFMDKDLTADIINNEPSFGIVPYYW